MRDTVLRATSKYEQMNKCDLTLIFDFSEKREEKRK